MAAMIMSRLRDRSDYSLWAPSLPEQMQSYCRDRMDSTRAFLVTTRQVSHTHAFAIRRAPLGGFVKK
jgi:hypothetical protein